MDITKLQVGFYNLQNELRKFPAAGTPHLDTVVEAIAALIRDLYNHYSPSILQAPVEDYALLCGSMYAVADLLCDLHNAHRQKIQELGGGDLPDQFQAFRKELLDTQNRILDQKGQLQALQDTKAELQVRLEQEKRSLAQNQAEENRITALNGELDRVCRQISAIDLPGLRDQTTALEAQKAELEQKKGDQNAAIAQLQQKLDSARNELTTLEGECTRQEHQLQAMGQKLATATALRKQREQALAQATDAEAAENQRAADLKKDITAAEARLQQAKLQTSQLNDTLTQRLAEESAATAEEQRLSGDVQAAQDRKALLDRKITEYHQIQRSLTDVETSITTTETNLAASQEELQKATSRRDGLKEALRSSREATQALVGESEKLEPQVREAEVKQQEQQKIRDGLITTLTQAQTRADGLKAQAQELQQQITDTNAKASEAQGQIPNLNTRITEAEKTHNELLAQVQTLKAEIAYQTKRNDSFRKDPLQTTSDQLEQLKQEFTGLTLQHKELTADRDRLLEKRSQIESECDNIKVQTQIFQNKVDEAQQELNKQTLAYENKERELAKTNKQISIQVDGMNVLIEQIATAKNLLATLDPVATKAKYAQTKSELDEEITAIERMKEELIQLETDLSNRRSEYNQLRGERDSAQSECQALDSKLHSLRDPAVTEETARLRHRIGLMNGICDRLCRAGNSLICSDPENYDASQIIHDPRDAVRIQLDYANSALDELSDSISKYQQTLTKYIPANL